MRAESSGCRRPAPRHPELRRRRRARDTGHGHRRHASGVADVELEKEDFTGQGNGDVVGHGTHCAGTVSVAMSTDYGSASRAGQEALIGKVLDNDGAGIPRRWKNGSIGGEARREHHPMSLGFPDFRAWNCQKLDRRWLACRSGSFQRPGVRTG